MTVRSDGTFKDVTLSVIVFDTCYRELALVVQIIFAVVVQILSGAKVV